MMQQSSSHARLAHPIRFGVAAISLALALVTSGCGGDSNEQSPPTDSNTASETRGEDALKPTDTIAPTNTVSKPDLDATSHSGLIPDAGTSEPSPPTVSESAQAEKDAAEIADDPTYQIQLSLDPKINMTIIGRRPNLDLEFVNQDGDPINLGTSYAGKTLVISTIYTTCPMPEMCPRIAADFGWLAEQLPDDLRDDVQFILLSFDPQRDTPEALKAFGRQNGVDFEVTDLLRGDIEPTKAVMLDELEIPLEVNPTTNLIITHAMMVHIINPDGFVVVERTVNTSEPMETILKEIERAVHLPFDPTLIDVPESYGSMGG